MTITLKRTRQLMAAGRHRRILVIGDLMLDRYIYGGVSRISPEAPVPVVSVTHEKRPPFARVKEHPLGRDSPSASRSVVRRAL